MQLFKNFIPVKGSSVSSFILFLYSFLIFPVSCFFFWSGKCVLFEWEMISVSGSVISVPLILDPVGISFSNVVCFISACVMMFSSSYMAEDVYLSRFIWLVMLFVASMNLLIFIPSLVSLLIGWDGLGIVSFALIIYYQNMKSLAAGTLTALANRVGDVLILLAVGFCCIQGHWNILFMWDSGFAPVLAFCIVVAGMTKSAQIPFSSWLPAAMAAPTPVSALVHSSTLVTAGIFLLIRFYPFLSSFQGVGVGLLFISVLTLLMAGLGANYEYDLKKIIALSTLSQLGVMMMSISLGLPFLALFHLYTHALFKAMLFLCAGAIIHNNSHMQDIRNLGNLWSQMPLTISCLNVANLALCGAPFLSGFYSKDLILESSLYASNSFFMVLLIFLATGMTAAYSVRLSLYCLWSPSNHVPLHQNYDEDQLVTVPMMFLSLVTILGGSALQKLVLEFNDYVVLPLGHKVLTMAVTAVGVWVSVVLWMCPPCEGVGGSSFQRFSSWMWFLAFISTQPIIGGPLKGSAAMAHSLDRGWLEVVGAQGVFALVLGMSQFNQRIQSKPYMSFIFLSFLSVFMCFIVLGLS
uniref:NADH-ubiquinone oxidoreductase chain 5 n=1 Tax=Anatoma sp. MNHN-IM-2013-42003 TaxID=2496594 RepID=A0A6B7FMN9_9VEST|nr:NADH dehydrogenase subunit 5 [Anatoma sp. MNHN-IM-2013-42003]